jgi:ATP-dependent RNA helicase DeaD
LSNSPVSNFSELPLNPSLLRAISEMGFETPSPIQQQALPLLIGEPTDFLGLAGTGTGKTAAFAIPLIQRLDTKARSVQSLILCPTRELAMQVAGQISLLGKFMGVRVATVYGGAPFGDQVRMLKSGAQIVVGTPGRVIDHLERGTLILSDVHTLILDEADEMFSMGFKDELDKIIAGVSEDANTWLFSATRSSEVRRVVQSKLRDPKTVQVNRTAMLSSGVEQLYYRCQENEKAEMICKLMEAADDFYGLIFCQTKALVADLTRFMLDRGYKVDCLHGDMDQNSRERTMQAFRDKKLSVLVCTDVAARGLDVKDITHVVNYSLPREMESYVHRIGRTARSGKTGIVMNLLTFSHRHLLGRIEAHTKVRMSEGFVPSKREIAARKVARMLPVFIDQPNSDRVLEVMGEEFKTQLSSMTPENVAANFIVMMLPDIFGGDDSRKTKKAVKAPVAKAPASEAAPAARPAAVAKPVLAAKAAPAARAVSKPVPAPVVAAPIVAAASDVMTAVTIDAEADELLSQIDPELSVSNEPEVSPIEAAQLIVDALNDANAVTNDGDDDGDVDGDVDEGEGETLDESIEDAAFDEVESASVEASAQVEKFDAFGDEVIGQKIISSVVSSIDKPPRKKRGLDDEEIAALLEEPSAFGVVKSTPDRSGDSRPSATSRPSVSSRPSSYTGDSRPARTAGAYPRSQSQFRSGGPREERPRSNGFERGGGFERREGGFSSAPRSEGLRGYGRSNDRFADRGAGGFNPRGGDRPARPAQQSMTSTRPEASSRPAASSPRADAPPRPVRNRLYEGRPAAPANFAKPPKHEPGPARTEREGETGGLNRRARRAALFGRPVDGVNETSTN